MKRLLEHPATSIFLLLILSGYLFFFHLGGMALSDPDETFYAQTAKEMLERGEWLTPYLFGKPQFEKPILLYWFVESSYKLFGVNEFAARFPSAVFGFLGLVAVYLLGMLLFNKRVGILSALILATNVEYVMLSRACVTDMILATLIAYGFLFFLYGRMRGKGYFYILSASFFALATLTKGPIGVLLPGVVLLVYLILFRDLKSVLRIPVIPCLAVFFAIALPWYLVEYRLHGMKFVDAFFGFHNVTRFLESEHAIGSQFYYNIPIILGGFFPWSVFLPFGFWYIFTKAFTRSSEYRGPILFVLSWFFVIFIFFSISSTKLPTYVFPLFPALALIVAVVWDKFLKDGDPGGIWKGMRISYYILDIAVLAGVITLYILIKMKFPMVLGGAVVSASFLVLGFGMSLIAFKARNFIFAFFFIVFSVVLFIYPLNKLVLDDIERYETSKEVALKLASLMKPLEKVACESNYLSGVAFYTGKFPDDIDKHDRFVKFLDVEERVWCVLKEKNHIQLYTLDTKPYCMRPTYMVYKIGKRCIITNKVPDDGVYLVKRERKE
ncbi:MAG: glycosyltransferase family 39 protein [Candidatus Omnitrophota bacterium]